MTDRDKNAVTTKPANAFAPHIEPPWCNVCNKPVDEIWRDTPLKAVLWPDGMTRSQQTGQVIITVRCHGEEWTETYWRDPKGET